MRSRCLPPAFLCHMRITIAFNYLAPIIAPVAIDAARYPSDAECVANVRWLH
jgi:hypothetical protein